MMRRILSLLTALAVVFTLSSCAAESDVSSADAIVGKWKYSLNESIRDVLTKVIDDDKIYADIFYEFNSDKSGCSYASMGGEFYDRMDFTYEIDGDALTIDTGSGTFTISCVIKGNSMTVVEDGETVVFGKVTD